MVDAISLVISIFAIIIAIAAISAAYLIKTGTKSGADGTTGPPGPTGATGPRGEPGEAGTWEYVAITGSIELNSQKGKFFFSEQVFPEKVTINKDPDLTEGSSFLVYNDGDERLTVVLGTGYTGTGDTIATLDNGEMGTFFSVDKGDGLVASKQISATKNI